MKGRETESKSIYALMLRETRDTIRPSIKCCDGDDDDDDFDSKLQNSFQVIYIDDNVMRNDTKFSENLL